MSSRSISLSERFSPSVFGALIAAPAILALMIVVIYPLCYNIFLSFSEVDLLHGGTTEFVGFDNYIAMFTDPSFWNALGNTMFFALLAVSLEMVLGFAMALALNADIRGGGIVQSLLVTPVMIAPVAAALQWRWMYAEQYGVLNYLMTLLGAGTVRWLSNSNIALLSLVVVDVWQTFPFVMLIILAGLRSLPPDCYDAVRVDGASHWQTLWYVTIPLLRPVLLVALLIRTTDVFKIFDTVYILTGGGPGNATEVLGTLTYRQTFRFIDFNGGATLSIVSLFVSCAIGIIYVKIFRPSE